MKLVEILAKTGNKLTQAEDVTADGRVFLDKVMTPSPTIWKEVPISEYERWKSEIDKLKNNLLGCYEEDY